jgi:sterol desaturase/sphingolipid hydroxylase (fatty acid hydroxylase superfamily)
MNTRLWFLSKQSYYLDNYLFSGIAVLLLIAIFYRMGHAMMVPLILFIPMVVLGFTLWTLFEYGMHRFIFHHVMVSDHALHHANPKGYVGVPNFVSLLVLLVIAAPLLLVLPMTVAFELLLGLILGYLWYLTLHDRFHRQFWFLSKRLDRLRIHHDVHHRWVSRNFGVTTRLWDIAFRTIG